MEQTFTVDWAELKTTSTGKSKKDVSLTDEKGVKTASVTIWADFPGFADIAPGSKVTGTLTPAKDPRFGPTLYPPKAPKTAQGGTFKQKMMEETMIKKDTLIKANMDSKEEGIRMSSCNNQGNAAAVAILEAEMRLHPHSNPLELWKQLWEECRTHMWMNWDKVKTDNPPF